MRPPRYFVMLLFAVGLGICLGMLLRKPLGLTRAASDAAGSQVEAEQKRTKSESIMDLIRPEEKAAAKALKASTRAERTLWFATQAEHADSAGMLRLARLANGEETLVKFLSEHWMKIDPQGMYDAVLANPTLGRRNDYFRKLFKEWPKTDPEAVVAALTDNKEIPDLRNYQMTAVDELMKHHIPYAIEAMNNWSVSSFTPNMKNVAAWAKKDPEGAARLGNTLLADHAGDELMKEIGKGWGEVDPSAALAFAKELHGQKRTQFSHAAMEEWSKLDLDSAIAFAAMADGKTKADVGGALVAEWGKSDPASALDWSYENLAGKARTSAMAHLVKSIADQDVKLAADMITTMDPGGAQVAAASGLMEQWFWKDDGKHQSAALSWLHGLGDLKAQREAVDEVRWKWNRENPEEILAFVSGEMGNMASDRLIDDVGRSQARKDPIAALEWSKGLAGDRADVARKAVLDTWMRSQPEKLTAWAQSQSAEMRVPIVKDIASTLAYRSMDAAERWYGGLPISDQAAAREAWKTIRLGESDKGRMNRLLADE